MAAVALLPFAETSPWRLGAPSSPTLRPADGASTVAVRNNGVNGDGKVWINRGDYSHPVSYATTSDPLATITDTVSAGRTRTARIPANATIAAGSDKHMHVVQPDGYTLVSCFYAQRQSPTAYTASRIVIEDLRGSGIGPLGGTRAYGGSALGGLIRAWEVDPAHPDYTGRIDHPLAIALRNDQLYFDSVEWVRKNRTEGYYTDAAYTLEDDPRPGWPSSLSSVGFMAQPGYQYPATEQDYDSPYTYSSTGAVPMGAYFVIPGDVDVTALGLTAAGLMLAKAAQNYGVYVTDRAGTAAFYVEYTAVAGAAGAWTDALLDSGGQYNAGDPRKVLSLLRHVDQNTPASPNGAPLSAARRAGPGPFADATPPPTGGGTTAPPVTPPAASGALFDRLPGIATRTVGVGAYLTGADAGTVYGGTFTATPSVDGFVVHKATGDAVRLPTITGTLDTQGKASVVLVQDGAYALTPNDIAYRFVLNLTDPTGGGGQRIEKTIRVTAGTGAMDLELTWAVTAPIPSVRTVAVPGPTQAVNLSPIYGRLDTLEARPLFTPTNLGPLDARVNTLEGRPIGGTTDLAPLTGRVSALETQTTGLVSAVAAKIGPAEIAPVLTRVADLEAGRASLASSSSVSDLSGQVTTLGTRVDDRASTGSVTALTGRVTTLESNAGSGGGATPAKTLDATLPADGATDIGPLIQAAYDAGTQTIRLAPNTTYLWDSPVFLDKTSAYTGLTITGERATIKLGANLPTTSWSRGTATRFAVFANTNRSALSGGVVAVTDATRTTGVNSGALRSLLVHNVTIDGQAANRGFSFANRTAASFHEVTIHRARVLHTWWDYADAAHFEHCYSRGGSGPVEQVVFEQYQAGDGVTVIGGKADSSVGFSRMKGNRGSSFTGLVTGKMEFEDCSSVSITGSHEEGQQSTKTMLEIKSSQVTLRDCVVYENWSGVAPSITIDDSGSTETGSELTLDTVIAQSLFQGGDSRGEHSAFVHIIGSSAYTRVRARGLRSMMTSSGIAGKWVDSAMPRITSADAAITTGLGRAAARSLMSSGDWHLHRGPSGSWVVDGATPGLVVARAHTASPSIIQVTTGSGCFSGGGNMPATAVRYAVAGVNAAGQYTNAVAAAAVTPVAANGMVRILVGLDDAPCVVDVWRSEGTADPLTSPSKRVSLMMRSPRQYLYDTGDHIAGQPWSAPGGMTPSSVAAANSTTAAMLIDGS